MIVYLARPGVPAVRAGGPLGQVGSKVPPVHLSPVLMTEVSQESLIPHLATVLTHLITEHHLCREFVREARTRSALP